MSALQLQSLGAEGLLQVTRQRLLLSTYDGDHLSTHIVMDVDVAKAKWGRGDSFTQREFVTDYFYTQQHD